MIRLCVEHRIHIAVAVAAAAAAAAHLSCLLLPRSPSQLTSRVEVENKEWMGCGPCGLAVCGTLRPRSFPET
ncbi:hypothetical protein ACLOJK_011913 [Asimina triloba]